MRNYFALQAENVWCLHRRVGALRHKATSDTILHLGRRAIALPLPEADAVQHVQCRARSMKSYLAHATMKWLEATANSVVYLSPCADRVQV
jgi:hypothetical protein